MSFVKIILCCLSFTLFLLSALLLHVVTVFFPKNRWKAFSYLNKLYARSLRMIAGVRVVIEGKANIPSSDGYLVISNHRSYLDGVILGSLFPVIYLSKKAIKKWPGINWMASVSGTIFIDRKRKSASPKSIDDMAHRLGQGANVLLFPEGTSTNGDKLKEFQSVFFAAPLVHQSPIVPVFIHYQRVNGEPITRSNRHSVYWWGQIPFQSHLYQLLRIKTIDVKIKIFSPVETGRFQNSSIGRKELARYTHGILSMDNCTLAP